VTDDDHTVDADPAALDQLRRLATRAEREAGAPTDDHTVDADGDTLEQLRRLARDAEAPTVPPAAPPPRDLTELDMAELDGLVGKRPPAPPEPAEPWRPPPRSMRPASMPDVPERHASAVWRWVALGLAAVLVVLVAWLLLDSDNVGEEVPTSIPGTPSTGSVVTTGVLAEGGSGG
jgi:hypothetical protein